MCVYQPHGAMWVALYRTTVVIFYQYYCHQKGHCTSFTESICKHSHSSMCPVNIWSFIRKYSNHLGFIMYITLVVCLSNQLEKPQYLKIFWYPTIKLTIFFSTLFPAQHKTAVCF